MRTLRATLTISSLATAIALTAIPLSADAGVKSLSSDEMVQTYIKDSAIIIVPQTNKSEKEKEAEKKKQLEEEENAVIRTLTISPGEPVVTDADKQRLLDKQQKASSDQISGAVQTAEEQLVKQTLLTPLDQISKAQPVADFSPTITPVVFGQLNRVTIPDAPFTQSAFGNQLGLSYDGQKVTFSFGNSLPGVSTITMPQAIHQGGIDLTPKPGGGFDLSIAVPKN
ncbi:hypothetical protein [Mangrovitalea sediminis]|uniref:hypothetical protein n=1 Tax=Mangrovitalea sediminis TaxID=1982043 RepID=UPI000BE4E73D|nr:hypothetical protein [Mangrovitalea sediminis]